VPTWRWLVLILLLTGSTARADWPTIRGDVARSGLVREELHPPWPMTSGGPLSVPTAVERALAGSAID
jgi:hypothetical protein